MTDVDVGDAVWDMVEASMVIILPGIDREEVGLYYKAFFKVPFFYGVL